MSLSRLWQQGKRDEAHELLALVYGWFSEGFDTADLQEAKVLYDFAMDTVRSLPLPDNHIRGVLGEWGDHMHHAQPEIVLLDDWS
jgi:hypothetical protein